MSAKLPLPSAFHLLGAAILLSGFWVPPAPASEGVVEEIVVTARKRAESLQDAPLAVSAFSAAQLQERNIGTVTQLGAITPNLLLDAGAGASGSNSAATIFIRGVGQTDFTLSVDPGVGLYVDGVNYGQQVGTAVDLLDIERVEVLRGPQGTLFGRNTVGGAINIITKAPAKSVGGKLALTVGSDDQIDTAASLDLPLNESLRSKFDIGTHKRAGYVDRTTTGKDLGDDDSVAARAVFLWTPAPRLEVTLSADWTREREGVAPEVLVGVVETSPIVGFYNRSVGAPCFPPPGSLTDPRCYNAQWVSSSHDTEHGTLESVSNLDLWGAALTVNWDLGATLLKSITAYRDMQSYFSLDNDHSPLTLVHIQSEFLSEQHSQELQLTGQALGDRLDWLVGAYYYDESAADRNPVDFSIGSLVVGGDLDVRSRALFAQATYSFTPKLGVTVGVRRTQEEKTRDPRSFVTTPFILGPAAVLPAGTFLVPPGRVTVEAAATSPLFNVAYHWTDSLMTYATYTEGFKGGGFTDRVARPVPAAPTFEPEHVDSYEIGLKTSLFDRRLQLNTAAFYMDYTDVQLLVAGSIAPTVQNAARARIQGLELELQAAPAEGLRMGGGLGYIDAQYTRVDPLATEVTLGKRLPKTPEWSANAFVAYEFRLGSYGVLVPRIDWAYRSRAYNDALNDPRIAQDGYQLLDAGLSFETTDRAWRFALNGSNLTDESYALNGKSNATQGIAAAIFNRPAAWSLAIERRF